MTAELTTHINNPLFLGSSMVRWLNSKRHSPIGVDIGAHSVKLAQFSADGSRLIANSQWAIESTSEEGYPDACAAALRSALDAEKFRGVEAVIGLADRDLFMQNIRVPKLELDTLKRQVQQEAAARVPFPINEAEIRFINTADVKQGEVLMREVILLACHRPRLEQMTSIVQQAKLRPIAVDVEPLAVMRSNVMQFRRDEDHSERMLFVHVGYSKTSVVISEGEQVLFVKYIDVGGEQMDAAVSESLGLSLADGVALRRHNGDRRVDQQDPDVTRGIATALRPVLDQLTQEISLCVRYHSVTFRGKPLSRMLLSGGEASDSLLASLTERLDLRCEISDPFRSVACEVQGRRAQWDVATGLAMRPSQAKTQPKNKS